MIRLLDRFKKKDSNEFPKVPYRCDVDILLMLELEDSGKANLSFPSTHYTVTHGLRFQEYLTVIKIKKIPLLIMSFINEDVTQYKKSHGDGCFNIGMNEICEIKISESKSNINLTGSMTPCVSERTKSFIMEMINAMVLYIDSDITMKEALEAF